MASSTESARMAGRVFSTRAMAESITASGNSSGTASLSAPRITAATLSKWASVMLNCARGGGRGRAGRGGLAAPRGARGGGARPGAAWGGLGPAAVPTHLLADALVGAVEVQPVVVPGAAERKGAEGVHVLLERGQVDALKEGREVLVADGRLVEGVEHVPQRLVRDVLPEDFV